MDENHVGLQDAVLLVILVDEGFHELELEVGLGKHFGWGRGGWIVDWLSVYI